MFLIGTIGCTTSEPPRFTPSAEVLALAATAETDEEKKLWQELQQRINEQVAKRFGTPFEPRALENSGLSRAELAFGARVFVSRCQPCHGTSGDGNGPVAQYLKPLPRDYTKGVFKFTSTPYGSKPRRSDLVHTIQRGVPGTSMPSFADLPPDELDAVVDYVIYLSQRGELEHELATIASQEEELNVDVVPEIAKSIVQRWKDAQSSTVMPLTPMPPFTPETVAKGQELFKSQACNKCHGLDGRGGTFGGLEVGKDVWGHEAAAADLTSGMFRGDGRPIDIYRRIYSGISGTPMPGFAQAFAKSPDDIWYLVHFIRDMGERRRRNVPPPSAPSSTPPPPPTPASEPATAPPESKAAQLSPLSSFGKST
jgi:mono/diheme cytochrome c family protein